MIFLFLQTPRPLRSARGTARGSARGRRRQGSRGRAAAQPRPREGADSKYGTPSSRGRACLGRGRKAWHPAAEAGGCRGRDGMGVGGRGPAAERLGPRRPLRVTPGPPGPGRAPPRRPLSMAGVGASGANLPPPGPEPPREPAGPLLRTAREETRGQDARG